MTVRTGPPPLTPQHRQIAIDRAREARVHRAAFLRRVRRGELTMADIFHIADEDPVLAKLKISSVLTAFRGVTPQIAAGYLADAGVNRSRRLRGVGKRQRVALVQMLDL